MPHGLRDTFVVSGHIPGFSEGTVVDLETGRMARWLTAEDVWLLRRYRHHLQSLSSITLGAPRSPNPAAPRALRAVK